MGGSNKPSLPLQVHACVCIHTHTHTHTHTQPAWQALAVANTEPQKESKQKSRHGIRCLSGRCLPAEWRVDGGGRGWRQDSSWDACLQLFREKIIKVGIKVMFEFSKVGLGHWKKKGRGGGREGGKERGTEERREGGRGEGRKEWSDPACMGQVSIQRTEGIPCDSSEGCVSWRPDWKSKSGLDNRECSVPGYSTPTLCHKLGVF